MSNQIGKQELPFGYKFLAGSLAGVSETSIMYPLDVMKTRLQLQAVCSEQLTFVNGFIDLLKREKLSTIYKGVTSPLLMEVPKRATKFACNSNYQSFLQDIFQKPQITQSITIIAGAMAGVTEAIIIVPFELVKIRLQDINSIYETPFQCFRSIVKQNGIFAIYTGLEATIWRNSVWNSGYFGLMHLVKTMLPKPDNDKTELLNNFVAGIIGGSLSCFLSVPFDVIKSQIQRGNSKEFVMNKQFVLVSVWKMYKLYGIRSMYRGITPILCRYAPGGGILSLVYYKASEIIAEFLIPS